MKAEPQARTASPDLGAAGPGMLLGSLARALQGWVANAAELVALEARLAALSLSLMVSAATALGVLLVSAWLLLWVAGVAWLAGVAAPLPRLLGAAALFNFLGACALWWWIRRLARDLLFRESRAAWIGAPGTLPPSAQRVPSGQIP